MYIYAVAMYEYLIEQFVNKSCCNNLRSYSIVYENGCFRIEVEEANNCWGMLDYKIALSTVLLG